VNIVGSLFYGTILGIFLIAFYFKKIRGNATFFAAIIAELTVLACHFFMKIPYLWFTVIGCLVLVSLAHLMNPLLPEKKKELI
jgi:SSS family solute:Na+ symporter